LPTLTLLFAPLRVGERVLGAMTVQSLQAHSYGERERLIFRTLCAYGAIALDNAAPTVRWRRRRNSCWKRIWNWNGPTRRWKKSA
jgi:transcriptional regulator with GAF, ATPase, and Fis domain